MAIHVEESWQSRSRSGESIDLMYTINGSSDDLKVVDAVVAQSPPVYDGLRRELPPTLRRTGVDIWESTVRYSNRIQKGGGAGGGGGEQVDSTIQFDTGGGTVHITQAIETRSKHAPPGEVAPDRRGAIGWNGEDVEGVDIVIPKFSWSETHHFPAGAMSGAYRKALFETTGKVNRGEFRGFGTREVLFEGATGSKSTSSMWEITFRFAASVTETDLKVGEIDIGIKWGWDYLWIDYGEKVDADRFVKVPVGAYIEKVYEQANFSALKIVSDPINQYEQLSGLEKIAHERWARREGFRD